MKRLEGLDAARGLLMLYIVAVIHGIFWLRLLPVAAGSWLLFEMPAIFIVSGYAYAISESSARRKELATNRVTAYFLYLASRFARILIPYAVYVLTCVALIYSTSFVRGDYSLSDLLVAWMNPFNYGLGYSRGPINWHLWFIPVFLAVTATMPFAAKVRPFANPNLLLLAAVAFLALFLLTRLHFRGESLVKQTVFYLLFSLLGYYMALRAEYFANIKYSRIAACSALLLAVFAIVSQEPEAMSMRRNKFPPNHIFFLFSCLWISLFLAVVYKAPRLAERFQKLGTSFWLRPFVTAGYSIYLWQGLGYSMAMHAGRRLHLPTLGVWILAIALSVGFGLLASPAERIRLRLSRAA